MTHFNLGRADLTCPSVFGVLSDLYLLGRLSFWTIRELSKEVKRHYRRTRFLKALFEIPAFKNARPSRPDRRVRPKHSGPELAVSIEVPLGATSVGGRRGGQRPPECITTPRFLRVVAACANTPGKAPQLGPGSECSHGQGRRVARAVVLLSTHKSPNYPSYFNYILNARIK